MVLNLLPTDDNVDEPIFERICALQIQRNNLESGVRNGNANAVALRVVIDELIEQLRERNAR